MGGLRHARVMLLPCIPDLRHRKGEEVGGSVQER